MRIPFLIVVLCLLVAAPTRADESQARLEAANRLLRAELELARTKQLYFLCDLNERRIQFKTAGITVAELPITGLRWWGRRPASGQRSVQAKLAPFSPQREKVGQQAAEQSSDEKKPETEEKKEPGKIEIKALEINDMPTNFTIVLDDGLRLNVRPEAEKGVSRWREKSHLFAWYLTRPLISDWNFLHGRTYTELHLTMSATNVQLLYWSLAEGSPFLLAPPTAN